MTLRHFVIVVTFAVTGCGASGPAYDQAALQDPESCKGCHPAAYREWAMSMHAYSGDDPLFIAAVKRGQRVTGGKLGSFCVGCHSPMAVRAGITVDGTDLQDAPRAQKGVGCYYCHTIAAVTADHDNHFTFDDSGVFFGGIPSPVATSAHASAYHTLYDRQLARSSDLCGACHDILLGDGTPFERVYREWKDSLYAHPGEATLRTCGKCHMGGREGLAATSDGAPRRLLHDHAMPAVDVALTDGWPDDAAYRAAVLGELSTSVQSRLCVVPDQADTIVTVTLDSIAAGHGFPSGASFNRRAWVELVAIGGGATMLSTGAVADGEPVLADKDPDLWLMRDRVFDKDGTPTSNPWDVATVSSDQLPPAVTNDPGDPRYYHAVTRSWRVRGARPDEVTLRVRMRSMPLEVLQDLVATGDLDRAVLERLPTFTLEGATQVWRRAGGFGCVQ